MFWHSQGILPTRNILFCKKYSPNFNVEGFEEGPAQGKRTKSKKFMQQLLIVNIVSGGTENQGSTQIKIRKHSKNKKLYKK